MPKPTHCIVAGCPNESHAKGYCRRHYGQIWRRGMIYNDAPKDQTSAPESGMRRDDRLKALERELKKAQQMYEVVVGFQGRIKWRREMEAVQHEIRKITEAEAEMNAADSGISDSIPVNSVSPAADSAVAAASVKDNNTLS
jgi:hypothetical protein